MKKLFVGILSIIGIGLSFCNGQDFSSISSSCSSISPTGIVIYTGTFTDTVQTYHKLFNLESDSVVCFSGYITDPSASFTLTFTTLNSSSSPFNYSYPSANFGKWFCFSKRPNYPDNTYFQIRSNYTSYFEYFILNDLFCNSSSASSINVLYNNENSTSTITCNGDNVIQIDGLSTITATNTFTPYFNINYKDQDNQLLTESYSKDILYLSGGLFKKSYTGDNDWILSVQKNENLIFTGYTPFFDVTGSVSTIDDDNVFINFSDNALKVLLSNIPSYIQYITIFGILLFLFGFLRRFKRRR